MKPKASENKAGNVETAKINREKRKALAAELGELTLQRIKLSEQLNQNAARSNQIAAQMERL